MIIALYGLALAMIAGGLFAAILGWDIVLVERGWTMVISGIVGASSGALLFGLASVVSRLGDIQQELARIHQGLEDDSEAEPLPSPAAQARGRIMGDLAGGLSAGALAGGLFGHRKVEATEPQEQEESGQLDLPIDDVAVGSTGPGDLDHETESYLAEKRAFADDRARPVEPVQPYGVVPDDVSEGKVPDFLFAERYRETAYTEVASAERESFLPPESPAESSVLPVEPPPLEESDHQDDVFEAEAVATEEESSTTDDSLTGPEVAASEEDEAAAVDPDAPPTVVGTYNSGDNKYVMYSNGSIEAETPDGFFQFASLEELKDFIAGGGESSSARSD